MLSPNKNPALLIKNLRRLTRRRHPAILIFGHPSVGKKTLLQNMGLPRMEEISTDANGLELINTGTALFIICEEMLYLENYWPQIEKYIAKILWVIDAPHLLAHSSLLKTTHFFKTIRHSIAINLAVSHCDRLAGFFDFFAHLRPEEIENPLGFSYFFEPNAEQGFLEKCYQNLARKLHDERSPEKRRLIREFPIQIERCMRYINQEIGDLVRKKQVDCIFYFGIPQKSYFTNNMLAMILAKKKSLIAEQIYFWRWLALPLTPLVLSAAIYVIHQAYHVNDVALRSAQKIIDTPQEGNRFFAELNKLYLIHQDLLSVEKWPISLGFNQTLALEKQSGLRYETLLQTEFKSQIMDSVKKSISDNLNKNRLDLYNALATYLMLTTEDRFNAPSILQWFTLLWRKEYATDNKMQLLLKTHLQNFLAQVQTPFHQDKALVLEARSFLSTLSPAEMAFLRLENQYPKAEVSPLGENQMMPGVNLGNAAIPVFYDTENFKKIFHTDIPTLVEAINEDNWVLGISTKIELSEAQKAGLVEEVQKIYLDNFAKQWANVLMEIQLSEPKTLAEAERNLQLLSDENSPFLQLLKAIVTNINLSSHPDLAKIKPLTEAITQLTTQQSSLQNLIANLNALEKALNTVSKSKNQNEMSFEIASAYFANIGENNLTAIDKDAATLPEPLKTWVNTTANYSLNLLMNNARSYINAAWKKDIFPVYQAKILNQFPIFSESTTEVSFADFKAFFGPKGLIDRFFTKYLQNFVDIQSQYWTFKKLNGQAFPIEQKKLNMLIRASLIQEMFFTDNPEKISLTFYLTPISMNPQLRSFSINIDGQKYTFMRKSRAIVKFLWPIPKSSQAAITFTPKRLKVDDDEATPFTVTQTGAWAWFRLIQPNAVRPSGNAQVFTLSFTNEGKRVRFKLATDNLMNPYLPNIIDKFRCPDDL